MKMLEFESRLDPHKKLMVVLFWTNRKTVRNEGCTPFLLKKITTPDATFVQKGSKLLKLSDEIFDNLEKNIADGKSLSIEIEVGSENIETTLVGNTFTISARSSEIENEVVDKLSGELQKRYPSVCESFGPRVIPQK